MGVADRKWQFFSYDVNKAVKFSDYYMDCAPKIAELLAVGVQVHIFYGDQGYTCNWEGGLGWMQKMEWKGQDGFNKARLAKIEYGEIKRFENLRLDLSRSRTQDTESAWIDPTLPWTCSTSFWLTPDVAFMGEAFKKNPAYNLITGYQLLFCFFGD